MASLSRQSLHPAKKKTSLEELVFSRIDLTNERGVITAMKKVTLRYNTRIKDVSLPGRFAQHSDRYSSLFAELQ